MVPQGLKSMLGGPSKKDRDTEPSVDVNVVRRQAPTHRPTPSTASSSSSSSACASASSSATLASPSTSSSSKAPSPGPLGFAFTRSSSSLAFWKRSPSASPREAQPVAGPPHEAGASLMRGASRKGKLATVPGRAGAGKGVPGPRGTTPALSQDLRAKSLPARGVAGLPGRKGSRSLGGGVRGSRDRSLAKASSRRAFSGPLGGASMDAVTGAERAASPGLAKGARKGSVVRNVKPGRRSEKKPTGQGREALRRARSTCAEGSLGSADAPVVGRGTNTDCIARSCSHRSVLETHPQAARPQTAHAGGAPDADPAPERASAGSSPSSGRASFRKAEAFRRLSSDKWASMGSLTEEEDGSAEPDLLDFESVSIGSGEAQEAARDAPDGHGQLQAGYAECLRALSSDLGDHRAEPNGSREPAFAPGVGGGAPALHPHHRVLSPAMGKSPLGSPRLPDTGPNPGIPSSISDSVPDPGIPSSIASLGSSCSATSHELPSGVPGRVPQPGGVMRSTSMAVPGAPGSPKPGRQYQRQRSEMRPLRSPLASPAAFPSAEELVARAGDCVATLRCAEGGAAKQAAAAQVLRQMAKEGPSHARAVLASGALGPLVELLQSPHTETVEHCATALLNVALHERFKGELLHVPEFLDNTVFVLYSGSLRAKSSAAATLCCVSTLEGAREAIMGAGALAGLVSLVRGGDDVGKRDAANCLLSLCISRAMRLPIAQSEAVAALCEVVQEGSVDLDQQAASVFSALARIPEGRDALLSQGALNPLAELVESGESAACREHAVTALLGLAMNDRGCLWQIDELGIGMALDVLSRSENASLQAKAAGLKDILSKFACEE